MNTNLFMHKYKRIMYNMTVPYNIFSSFCKNRTLKYVFSKSTYIICNSIIKV